MNGENLKKLRTEKGYSLAKLASESGVSSPYIFDLEKGFKANPSLSILLKLAKALDCSTGELFEEEDK